jgi:hypothetical protein
MEWLGSPIVYLEVFTVADQMRDLMWRYYSPIGFRRVFAYYPWQKEWQSGSRPGCEQRE